MEVFVSVLGRDRVAALPSRLHRNHHQSFGSLARRCSADCRKIKKLLLLTSIVPHLM